MNRLFLSRLWTVLATVFATILVAFIIGTGVAYAYAPIINVTLHIQTFETVETGDGTEDTEYFKSDYKTIDEIYDFAFEASKNVEAEGLVLLKNEQIAPDVKALPMAKNSKVSLFGTGSAYINCSSQGMRNPGDKEDFPTLKEALEGLEGGTVEVNPDLWEFYTTGLAKDYGGTKTVNNETGLQTYYVNEAPWNLYSAVENSFADYGDAAIVVLTRDSTEGSDANATHSDTPTGDYLTLHENERELLVQLSRLRSSGTFDRLIVLLNSAVHIQLDFLDDPAITVDGMMWIGNTGMSGIHAVAEALVGDVNPSGRLTDTLVKDNFSSPAMASLSYNDNKIFSRSWTDDRLNVTNRNYGVYVEGIYVGYRYYETRYSDLIEGRPGVGPFEYEDVVAYPFGYGSSYTEFAYSDLEVTPSADGETFDVSVTVTNTGSVPGKETVQLYVQKPYTEYARTNMMEVAAVELIGYGKTNVIEAGRDETVTISVEKADLASYDVYGAGTYILDAGDYYLTAAKDAHDAANNILAAKNYSVGMTDAGNRSLVATGEDFITVTERDTTTYAVSREGDEEAEITNRLGHMDINRYAGMGNNYVTYVSRNDWVGTWPSAAADIVLNDILVEDLQNVDIADVEREGTLPTYGVASGLTLAMMRGKTYDDEQWKPFLDQMSFDEVNTLLTTAICNTAEITSVAKPRTREQDGPTYCKESNIYQNKMYTRFPCEGIWAASFNADAIADVAKAIANEAVYEDENFLKYTGMYAPGLNIHRLPHGGRNHEYFSEDPYLAGMAAQAEIRTLQSYGVITFPKHYIFNEQEINRNGISVWLNEQSAREIYLRPWKYAVSPKRGNSHAVMTAFNRTGAKWASADSALIDILRDEFGFDGFILTDMADSNGATYMTTLDGMLAGTDAWLSSGNDHSFEQYRGNATIENLMRESVHRIMYVTANYSAAMNGMSTTTKIIPLMAWWEGVLIAVLVVFGVLTAGSIALLVISLLKGRRAASDKA